MPSCMLMKPHDIMMCTSQICLPHIAAGFPQRPGSHPVGGEARNSRCSKLRSRAGTPPCAASEMRGAKGIKAVADACNRLEVYTSSERYEILANIHYPLFTGTRGAMASSGACANPSLGPPVSTRQHCVSLSQLQSTPQLRLDGEKRCHLVGSLLLRNVTYTTC